MRKLVSLALLAGAATAIAVPASQAAFTPNPGCTDAGFHLAASSAVAPGHAANAATKAGMYFTALADDLTAWRTIRQAPLPCTWVTDQERTALLNGYGDYYRADLAANRSDFTTARSWTQLGKTWFDRYNGLIIIYPNA
jgi:hypothetical protein